MNTIEEASATQLKKFIVRHQHGYSTDEMVVAANTQDQAITKFFTWFGDTDLCLSAWVTFEYDPNDKVKIDIS